MAIAAVFEYRFSTASLGATVSVTSEFAKALDVAMDTLAEDEWAVVKAKERAVKSVTSVEAFESVVPVLLLAAQQNDTYAFSTCCWLARTLAEISDTTERPAGLDEAMVEVAAVAQELGCETDAAVVRQWYRYGT
jgi:hypothetical protein